MIKKFILFMLCYLGSVAAFCQGLPRVDSINIVQLKKKLKTLKNSERVDCLNELSNEYLSVPFFQNKLHVCYYYIKQAEKLALKLNYNKGLAYSLINLGRWISYRTSYSTLNRDYIHRAIGIGHEIRDPAVLGWGYLHLGTETDSAIYWKKALGYLEKCGIVDGIAESSLWIAKNYWNMGYSDTALYYCHNSLKYSKYERKKTVSWGYYVVQESLMLFSKIYENAGDFKSAMNHLFAAKSYANKYDLDWKMDEAIGTLHIKMGHFDSAMYYLKKNHESDSANFYTKVYLGEYYISNSEFLNALQIFRAVEDTIQKRFTIPASRFARVMLGIGSAYTGLKDFKTALPYLRHALPIEDKTSRISCYENLAKAYHGIGAYDSAYYYLDKYRTLKDTLVNSQSLWRVNNQLFQSERRAEDLRKANEMALLQKDILLKSQQLREQSLLQQQKESENLLLSQENKIKQQQYEQEALAKKEKEAQVLLLSKDNQLKNQQLQQQKTVRNLLTGGLLFFILACIFVIRTLALKRKNEKMARQMAENRLIVQQLENEKNQSAFHQQAIELEMQALRAQMNPHFIFNCLSSINKYIVKNETEAASDYLTRFSRLIRMVLVNSQKPVITLEQEFDMLKLYLDMERLRFKNSFDYSIKYTNAIDPSTLNIPPLLLQPFCENAIWHGLMHRNSQGRLDLEVNQEEDMLVCVITDNGVGRIKAAEFKSKTAENQKSLGLQITNNRLTLLNKDNNVQSFYDMSDIVDKNGLVSGTRVTVQIRCKELNHEYSPQMKTTQV